MMDQKLVFDHLTIEEYVHNSSVLAAGLSRNGPDDSAYISLIRDTSKIPLIMQSIEKDNKAASKALFLNLSLIHNVLAIYSPAYTGVSLENYSNTLQPYGSFDLVEKIIANLSQYESLDMPIYLQLLSPGKYIVDSNGMPHIQFWIDDLLVFSNESLNESCSIKNEKLSELIRSTFSDDFTPKQLVQLADEVQNGRYDSCLTILNALKEARQAYYASDSERKGEAVIQKVWGRMQRSMLLIVLIILALVYALYWYYYSKPTVSTTVYKTKIGDVAFIVEPETGQQEIESETYILLFPEEPAEQVPDSQPSQPTNTEPEQVSESVNIIIRPGDNLFRISLKHYGDGSYYSQLAEYNKIQNPDLIPVGLSLEIPPLEILLSETGQ